MFEEGVAFYLYHTIEKSQYYIIDDTTLEGGTLAKRRLKLLKDGIRLKKLTRAVFFLGDLIKIAKPTTWMIDSAGNIFKYKKQLSVKLTYKKIKQVIPIKTGGAIIEVDGLMSRFKCLFKPSTDMKYAGIIQYGMGYILYDLSPVKYDDTRRKI